MDEQCCKACKHGRYMSTYPTGYECTLRIRLPRKIPVSFQWDYRLMLPHEGYDCACWDGRDE